MIAHGELNMVEAKAGSRAKKLSSRPRRSTWPPFHVPALFFYSTVHVRHSFLLPLLADGYNARLSFLSASLPT